MLSSPPGNHATQWNGDSWSKSVPILSAKEKMDPFSGFGFEWFFCNLIYWSFFSSVLVNQPAVHNGQGESVSLAVAIGDRWQVTGVRWEVTGVRWKVTGDMCLVTWERWHATHEKWRLRETLNLFTCAYMHRSRDSVFPVSGIFVYSDN